MAPFFSVVIPLYNKENYIVQTLNSLLAQSFGNFEVIVVNDGSTDRSEVKLFEIQDSRIRYFKTKNQGVSAARNLGIKNAQSEYICFLDADDIWQDNHLAVLYELISDFPQAGMYCNRYRIRISENKLKNPIFQGISNDYRGYINDYFYSSYINRVAYTSAISIKKEVFDVLGDFDVSISSGQDVDMWTRIALKYKVAISNQYTAVYNFQIEDSLSKTNILKKQLMDFSKFEKEEQQNPSLKKFLDLYRLEYAIAFYTFGKKEVAQKYLHRIAHENYPTKFKILFKLPSQWLRKLLGFKHYLKSKGIDFNIYN